MSTLIKRGDTWYLQYYVEGKRHKRSLQTTNQIEAELAQRTVDRGLARDKRERKEVGRVEVEVGISFDELAERFKQWGALNLAPRTLSGLQWGLDKFAAFRPLATQVEAFTRDDVEAWKRAMSDDGLSPTSINNAVRRVATLINRGLTEEWYKGPNPFHKVKMVPAPISGGNRRRRLSEDEIKAVLAAAAERNRDIYLFMLLGIYAGMRHIEIVNARWEWFALDTRVCWLQNSPTFRLKSREERPVPIHWRLLDALARDPAYRPEGFVIAPGRPAPSSRYRWNGAKSWKWVVNRAKVPWATPHTLRRTFMSRYVTAGISLYKIQKWAGHSTGAGVSDLYIDLDPWDPDIDVVDPPAPTNAIPLYLPNENGPHVLAWGPPVSSTHSASEGHLILPESQNLHKG